MKPSLRRESLGAISLRPVDVAIVGFFALCVGGLIFLLLHI